MSARREGCSSVIQQFELELDGILSRELNVDSITTFAEDVITDLSALSSVVTTAYTKAYPSTAATGLELEDKAFPAFNLPLLSMLLEHAQLQDEKIKQASHFISNKVKLVDTVITPPDKQESLTATGVNTYKKPGLKNRLQTLLYVVQELGVDLEDVTVDKGKIPPTSVRNESYATVEVPDLNRVVYVCDEEQNASFVFDRNRLDVHAITIQQLDNMTKAEKNQLVEMYPLVGRRFMQGPHWVKRLQTLLSEDFAQQARIVSVDEQDEWKGFWLDPDDGKHYGNLTSLEGRLTIGRTVIRRFIDEFDTPVEIRSGGTRYRTSDGFAYEDLVAIPELQTILAVPLTERAGEWAGFYLDADTGHRIGTILSIEKRLGIYPDLIKVIAERLGLPAIELRSATRLSSIGYDYDALLEDEEVQKMMRAPKVDMDGQWKDFWTDVDGSHWGSISAIRTVLGVHHKIVSEQIKSGEYPMICTQGAAKRSDSYRLEDFVNQPKIRELVTAKLVEIDGEWAGFYTDPETGMHWAPLRTISNRLDTHDDQVKALMNDKDVATIPVRIRSRRAVAGVYTAYCFEQIIG